MKVAVPMTILIDVPAVRKDTQPTVSAKALHRAIRHEVQFIIEEAVNMTLDHRHVSMEDMVRRHLLDEGLLEPS